MMKLSITLRITLWYTLLMLLIVSLVLGFMLGISDAVIQNNAQARLAAFIDANAEEVEYDDGELEIDKDFMFHKDGMSALIYGHDLALIQGQPPEGFPADTIFEDGRTVKIATESEQFLVCDRLITFKKHPEIWVRGVLPLDAMTGIAGAIFQIALITLPFLVMLAAVGGYLITRRAFQPVRVMTQTVESIAGGRDLSRRIPMKGGYDEMHALAATFNGMLARLETSFEAEKQFVSDVSHELRTPVSVILAQCEYALGQPEEEAGEALAAIQRQAGRMHRLIVHLLNVTRLDNARAELQDGDVSALLTSLVQEAEAIKPAHMALRLEIMGGIRARMDAPLFTRLFHNLVNNAFKYGKSLVAISLGVQNGTVSLAVADDGIGILPEEQPKIWRRFYQVNPSRTADEAQSMGLGLSIAKQIALLHHGDIAVESKPGEGSRFQFTFPQA